jgi:aspartyl-tRNA(Asn)/glutamyl-tRNA(Gln) amidotransferase subunit C
VALTDADVAHVAWLARLQLTPDERSRLAVELEQVLSHMAVLNELATETVPPTYHVNPPPDPWRADVVQPGFTREQALANAPDARDGQFRVPRILEEAP